MLSKVVLAIVFGIIAFVTVVGNIMVMVSFKMDKQLQTISNYFLFRCICFFTFLAMLVAPHFTPVSHCTGWVEFRTSVASRLVSLFLQKLASSQWLGQ